MPRKLPFNEAQLRQAIESASSWNEAARLLGYRTAGGNVETVKRHAANWGISSAHFDPRAAQKAAAGWRRGKRRPLSEILVDGSRVSRSHLKDRLYEEGLKERRCELCGQTETWRGRRMSLVLDHINGVPDDNRFENLRIVCPNCDATLDTHCGRKLPRRRACAGCGASFAPRHLRHRYCCEACFRGARLAAAGSPSPVTNFGRPQPAQRRVVRPPFDQLMRELAASSYLAVGRKYGVSDNAVRKWVRAYQRERDRRAMDERARAA